MNQSDQNPHDSVGDQEEVRRAMERRRHWARIAWSGALIDVEAEAASLWDVARFRRRVPLCPPFPDPPPDSMITIL